MKKFLITASAILILAGLVFAVPFTANAADDVTGIENGICIGNVDVSGMSEADANAAVYDYVSSLEDVEIELNALSDNSITVTAGELGIDWANPDVVKEASEYGKTGNIIERYKAIKDLEYSTYVLPLEYTFDDEAIRTVIAEEGKDFDVEAVDATLSRENGAFVIQPGQTGVKINEEESAKAVKEYLSTQWAGESDTVDLVVETQEPRGTEEELSQVKDVLGTFTTSYATSGANRSGNVANGCRLINGTTVYPGDTFSAYEAVSPFTESNGYYMAGSYLNGLVVESLGGGICQVSTTLYNAVLRAELEVTQRSNHSMIVTYVDPSADAAISGTTKDFKFVNSSDHPIYIEGSTANKKITFTIYGVEDRPADRQVSYVSETLSRTDPVGEKVVGDGSKPVGFVDVQSAHTGYVAKLWKVVTVGGVEESRTEVNKSTYKAAPRTATVGTASADPNASAAINAAIATGSIDYCRAVAGSIAANPAIAAAQAQQAAAAAQAQAAAAAAAQPAPAQPAPAPAQ